MPKQAAVSPKYVRPVSDDQVLDALRHSSFDFYHAICEAIDNSIQSDAKNISIFTKIQTDGTRKKRIVEVACLDDGDGMNKDILHNCLRLGYGTRINDRHGIGRFGVGMTLAAISQCRRMIVISKDAQMDKFLETYLDLDELSDPDDDCEGIPEPINMKQDYGYDLSKQKSGTLVIWQKCDRVELPHKIDEMDEECHYFLGRVYRYWLIRKKIRLFFNQKEVHFHDPLFEHKSNCYPQDPISSKPTEMSFDYPIPSHLVEEGKTDGKTHSKVVVRMALLPEEFRKERYAGGKDFPGRYLDRNEGVSILRANREVHFDHIKFYKPMFKEADRWWSCEIYFDPILDDCFKIQNIKLGVRLEKDLRELIQQKIEPTRREFLKVITKDWDKNENLPNQNGETKHSLAETTAKTAKVPIKKVEKSEDEIESETKKILEQLAKDSSAKERSVLLERIKTFPFTIEEKPWPGDLFLDDAGMGDNIVLIYNSQHEFFRTFYERIRNIVSSGKYDDDVKQLSAAVDLLLIAFCGAKRNMVAANDGPCEPEKFFNSLLRDWGVILTNFIENLKKEKSK